MRRIGVLAACLLLAGCVEGARSTGGTAGGLMEAPAACGAAAIRFRGTWDGEYSFHISNGDLTTDPTTTGKLLNVGQGLVQAVDAWVDHQGVVTYKLVSSNGETGTCTGTADRWTVTTTCTVSSFAPLDPANLPPKPDPTATPATWKPGTLPTLTPACVQTVTRVDRIEFGRDETMTSTWTGTVAGDTCPYAGATVYGTGVFTRSARPPDTAGLYIGAVRTRTTLLNGTAPTTGMNDIFMQAEQTGSMVVTDAQNTTNGRWTHCVGPQVGDLVYKWCSVASPSLGTGCYIEGLNVGKFDHTTTPESAYNAMTYTFNASCGPSAFGKMEVVVFNTLVP